MTVYVDTMRAKYGQMVMCHMLADSEEELHEMADFIGLNRRWYQGDHYDISLTLKKRAIASGARLVNIRVMAIMRKQRRTAGVLCTPEEAQDILSSRRKKAC